MRIVKKACIFLIVLTLASGLMAASSAPPQKAEELQSLSGLYIPPINKPPADGPATQKYYQRPDADKKNQPYGCVVAFTFDDGCRTDYFIAYPILKKYGIRGTSYLIPGYIESGLAHYMNWEQVKEMAAFGWAFGCHTYAHKDLTKMTADEIKQSMEKVNAAFLKQGLKTPVVAAYPYGRYNGKVIKAMKPYRKQIRKAYYESKLIDLKNVDPYEIDSVSADMQEEDRIQKKKELIDAACRQNIAAGRQNASLFAAGQQKKAIVFRVHALFRNKPDDMGKFVVQTKASLFEELVRYCVKKGCVFVTMEELMAYYS